MEGLREPRTRQDAGTRKLPIPFLRHKVDNLKHEFFKSAVSRLLGRRNLTVRVARRPRVIPKGAVRLTCDLVEQRQVPGIAGLVHDDCVDRPGTFFAIMTSSPRHVTRPS